MVILEIIAIVVLLIFIFILVWVLFIGRRILKTLDATSSLFNNLKLTSKFRWLSVISRIAFILPLLLKHINNLISGFVKKSSDTGRKNI